MIEKDSTPYLSFFCLGVKEDHLFQGDSSIKQCIRTTVKNIRVCLSAISSSAVRVESQTHFEYSTQGQYIRDEILELKKGRYIEISL